VRRGQGITLRRSFADGLAIVFGTAVYSGYFPLFPGTVGAAAGVVLYLVLVRLGVLSAGYTAGWAVSIAAVFALGVASAHRCEKLFGTDNKRIVIDEVWGMLVSLYALPVAWGWILGAFLLFRFFDIVKPFPGRRAEKIGGGLAIMLDDGIAGAYTAAVLHLIRFVAG
jgi:phosphatidylglycerophosphatase A